MNRPIPDPATESLIRSCATVLGYDEQSGVFATPIEPILGDVERFLEGAKPVALLTGDGTWSAVCPRCYYLNSVYRDTGLSAVEIEDRFEDHAHVEGEHVVGCTDCGEELMAPRCVGCHEESDEEVCGACRDQYEREHPRNYC